MWESSIKQDELTKRTIGWIFLLGFLVRLYAALNTYVVNPDGTLYIYQAKALFYGQWNQLTSCGVNYLSIYPFLIVGAHSLFQDWIMSARAVSMLFGFSTLVPLYLICRLFFQRALSGMVLLILIMIPFLVDTCADVVRDPVCWFFVVLGLYFFLLQWETQRYRVLLALSGLAFSLGALARVEALLMIVVSFFYLCLTKQEKKLARLAHFTLAIVLIILLFCFAVLLLGVFGDNMLRGQEVVEKGYGVYAAYKGLRASLLNLSTHSLDALERLFFTHARRLLWWIALGSLLTYILKALSYPFFVIYAVGLRDSLRHHKNDRKAVYLSCVALAALIVLYIHILHSWHIYTRFMAMFLFSSIVVVGFGLERVIRFADQRLKLTSPMTFALLGLLIIASALPKNVGPREKDKMVFRELGEVISAMEGNTKPVSVLASPHAVAWVSFYANSGFEGAVCPLSNELRDFVGQGYTEFILNLKKRSVRYYVWEEKNWPQNSFDFLRSVDERDLREISEGYHPSTGKMVLFKVL
jgi:4-amino-4-deoxy-L-arabinose transferase-like glycosyltransferase